MAILAAEPSPANAGEKQMACAELYGRYAAAMQAAAAHRLRTTPGTKVEPIDVVHEVWAHLLRPEIARQFRRSEPLWPWLKTVLHNRLHDMLRKEAPHRIPVDEGGMADVRGPAPEAGVVARDAVAALTDGLTGEQMDLLRLYFVEDLKATDVAERLQWDVGRVYREAHRIKHLLRQKNRRSEGP